MSTGGTEAVETNAPPTPSVLKNAETGKSLVPTFEVVPDEPRQVTKDPPRPKRKVAKAKAKGPAKKAKAKTPARKAKAATQVKKAAKKATKKVAKKAAAKAKPSPRQLGARRAAALRNADPKLKKQIVSKRAELKTLTGKVSACEKQLKVLEKKLLG